VRTFKLTKGNYGFIKAIAESQGVVRVMSDHTCASCLKRFQVTMDVECREGLVFPNQRALSAMAFKRFTETHRC